MIKLIYFISFIVILFFGGCSNMKTDLSNKCAILSDCNQMNNFNSRMKCTTMVEENECYFRNYSCAKFTDCNQIDEKESDLFTYRRH